MSDAEPSSVHYVLGQGIGSNAHVCTTNHVNTVQRCRTEDQIGSLIGVSNETGCATDECFYPDEGSPGEHRVVIDGLASWIRGATADTPPSGVTSLGPFGWIVSPSD